MPKWEHEYRMQYVQAAEPEIIARLDELFNEMREKHVEGVDVGVYFGDEDIEVSRTDLLYYLAATDLNRASLSLVNTWSFDIDLGSLYSTDGTLVIDKQDLVDTMNDNFFAIRSTTELMEAQTFLAHGFQSLLSALEATPSTDGFGNIEKDATTADLFDQFYEIFACFNFLINCVYDSFRLNGVCLPVNFISN